VGEDSRDQYDLERIRQELTPAKVLHADSITSTNDWARREVESGAIEAPALLLADRQSAGRGRGANTWWSVDGNVFLTFILPQNAHLALGLVPLLAGLAVRRALVRLTGCDAIDLKWPNDLVAGGRKIAGLLCERLRRFDLVGVGINVNAGSQVAPQELRERITSLSEIAEGPWDLTELVCEMGNALNCVLGVTSEDAAGEMLREYARHHWPTGKYIELVDTDRAPYLAGRCDGLDAQGRLIVRTEHGVQAVLTGSVVSVTGPS
jgi:BirA family biotin operon repressor/biotin-[acetyl-CoA-carboxylase] ligase